MTASREFLDYVVDLLRPFGPVSIRRMFGGAGVYRDGLMFALVAYDTLYLKVDDETRPAFERAGMGPFTYEGKTEPVTMSYFEAPPDAMEEADLLAGWARDAYAAALRTKTRKAPAKPGKVRPAAPRKRKRR
ncbi:MAG: TfoX/Sxy family protein [Alphaproteobacteria bacterium]|nr:TfoX/Sxy family protein [Alphaproteobacteria bacterium]